MSVHNFIDWKDLPTKRTSGSEKTKCPSCSESRKNKSEKCVSVYHDDGVAKCWNCDALSFREENVKSVRDKVYETPPQDWVNHTNISDKVVNWIKDERHIRQETLIKLGVTEEFYWQPRLDRDVTNIVFNYFEGKKVVNKKYRTGAKHFTASKGGKPILYNINSAIGSKELWIV